MSVHNNTGKEGELLAADCLRKKGYEILHQNWRSGRQEIDIIAQYKHTLVFVEVKTRSGTAFGNPESFVDERKENYLEKASLAYIETTNYLGEIRFDIVGILFTKNESPQIHHIEDAFFPQ